MAVQDECLCFEIGRLVIKYFSNNQLDYEKLVSESALNMLIQIQSAIQDDTLDDFYKIEKIVTILESNGVDTGNCHDFG